MISAGCAIGYRKGANGGTWIARHRDDDGKQHYESLGAADDARYPDGLTFFCFPQAQERARDFFKRRTREIAGDYLPEDGPFTVTKTLETYFAERQRKGSKGLEKDKAAARVRILPQLGEVEVSKLSTKRIRDWQADIAREKKKSKAAKGTTDKTDETPDAVRARRASANRTLTVLKAALNYAFHEGRVVCDDAWRKVNPFREADAAVIRYLTDDEAGGSRTPAMALSVILCVGRL